MKKYILPIAVCILCAFLSACDTPGWMTDIFEAKTVTFDSRGGSPVPTQTLLFGERAKKPDDPTKPECVFTGWFEKNGSLYNFDSIPMTNITLYADWSEKDIVIEAAEVTLSHIPSTGQSTATTAAAGGTGYTCGEVSWYPSGGVFSALTVYTATVTLTAAAGRSFSDPITVTFNELPVTPVSRSGKSITVSRSFPATSKAVVTAVAVLTQPSKLTYAYGDSLDLSGLVVTLSYNDESSENVPYAQFADKGVTETPANGARLTIYGNNGRGVEVSVSDSVKTSTSNLTVNKAAGSAVGTPAVTGDAGALAITAASSLIPPGGEQSIEYAINTADAAPESGWQDGTTFSGILLDTTYYVFARSKADGNHNAGTAAGGSPIAFHKVTFNKNGGNTEASPAAKNAVSQAAIGSLPTAPTRTGYTFAGWYDTYAASGGNQFTASTTVTASVTVYARWTANTLSISYANGGGTGSDPSSPTSASYGTSVTMPPNTYTRTGYTFNGWAVSGTNSTPGTYAAGAGKTVAELSTGINTGNASITLTAAWTINNYTVTFDRNGGTTEADPTTRTANYNTTVALPTAPTKTGYGFNGWNTAAGGGGTAFNETTPVTGNITVYAQWTINSYTVTFNKNNTDAGSTDASPTSGAADYNGTVTLPTTNPTRTGYTFNGWNTAAGGGGTAFTAGTPVTSSITVYAQWTINSYTVTFNKNNTDAGSTDASPTSITANYKATVALPTAPTRTGYTFNGWNTAADGGGTAFTAGTPVTSSITVYAQWTINSYTVTFNKNNTDAGSTDASPTSITANYKATVALPTAPTRTGYAFNGWNTAADGGGTDFTASTPVIANITVYAQWRIYTLTINYAPGSYGTGSGPTSPTTANYGTNVTMPTNTYTPSSSTYAFTGWLCSGTTYKVGVSVPVSDLASGITTGNQTVTLTAQWATTAAARIGDTNSGNRATLKDAIDELNLGSGGTITILKNINSGDAGESATGYTISKNITITNDSSARTITVLTGSLFTVSGGATLILQGNTSVNTLTLKGISANDASLVYISGSLELKDHAIISGNTSSGSGAGVYLNGTGSRFEMNGTASIQDNATTVTTTRNGGGGVYIDGGTFEMKGGTISNNKAGKTVNDDHSAGGGVFLRSGTFNMSGGKISGNSTLPSKFGNYGGGGVLIEDGTFNMSGGEISDNDTKNSGGGVKISFNASKSSVFTMSGGVIKNNTSSLADGNQVNVQEGVFNMIKGSDGSIGTISSTMGGYAVLVDSGSVPQSPKFNMEEGIINSTSGGVKIGTRCTLNMSGGKISNCTTGVYLSTSSTNISYKAVFTMNGGEISDNTNIGVYIYRNGTFTMKGGTITGNSVTGSGAGVYVGNENCSFEMSGGIISGNTATNNGGGVYTNGTFTMSGGTINGSTGVNPNIAPTGASLFVDTDAIAKKIAPLTPGSLITTDNSLP